MENNSNNQFNLPEGYFNHSKANILNKMEWLNEHEAYPVLSKLKGESGFIIPENYFHSNAIQLELIDLPVLNSITKQNLFETPAHYFEISKAITLSKEEHDTELSELHTLKQLRGQYPLTVSDTYFTESKKRILETNTKTTGAKIISLSRKPIWYAAAAILTITIGLWIYNSYFKVTEVIDGDCNTLACIEKRELLKYKLDNLDNEELYEMVNTDKLLKNLTKKEVTDSLKTNDSADADLMDLVE